MEIRLVSVHEFDWTGTQDISGTCGWCAILPAVIEGMDELVDGGWHAIMQHNHNLAIQGDDVTVTVNEICSVSVLELNNRVRTK